MTIYTIETIQDGRFAVLARAMEESAFANKLRSVGNTAITILAPSDEAFQKIPTSRLEAILKDKEARLGMLYGICMACISCNSHIVN